MAAPDVAQFKELYDHEPLFYIRCPGRVNLIGEHIDYNGYSVLPMAIEQETRLLVGPSNDAKIRFKNGDNAYAPYEISLPTSWNGVQLPGWYDYLLSGWKGVMDVLGTNPKGFNLYLTGNIPASSGLSSSSSLVCAAALATLLIQTNEGFERLSREQLAEICAKSEQFVGTQGGGMDQAAEILSISGKALRINFNPLSTEAISLPDSAKFVVLHSGETMNKAATSYYNQRAVECRLAGNYLLHIAGKLTSHHNGPLRLKQVQELLEKDLKSMIHLVESSLPNEISREELEQLLGAEAVSSCLTLNTQNMRIFKLRSRARHVFSEALRVTEFEIACMQNDIVAMGELMNESHKSCSEDYECSSDALDDLVRSCQKAGVLGARLTGAGWGGCAVALVDTSLNVNLEHLNLLFTSRPSSGINYKRLIPN